MDIVERIRSRVNDAPLETERMLDDAVAEIERLRSDLEDALAEARILKDIAA